MFKGLVLNKTDDVVTPEIREIADDEFNEATEGNVVIRVEYSDVNYKDGMCLGGLGNLVRQYPHVPGIDFAGVVESSEHPSYSAGDRVALTGWRVGEIYWGGYAQRARVNGDFLVPLPSSISTLDAMTVGTAGITALFALATLEKQGLTSQSGAVLVTGAAGGVGSVAVALLAGLGYEVTAVSGRAESAGWLKQLGASEVLPREALGEGKLRPLDKERWAACIDSVGGEMLARVLSQMKYGGSVAAVGLAGGMKLDATVIPFLLRGVNLLGIDSVMRPFADRVNAWNRVSTTPLLAALQDIRSVVPLDGAVEVGADILRGKVRGRTVVDVNA